MPSVPGILTSATMQPGCRPSMFARKTSADFVRLDRVSEHAQAFRPARAVPKHGRRSERSSGSATVSAPAIGSSGSEKRNSVAPGSPECSQTRPPCASTMDAQIDRPKSQAVLLRRCQRVEQAARQARLDAGPVVQHADLDTRRRRATARRYTNVTLRLARCAMASTALCTRLSTTCSSWTRSPCMSGKSAVTSRSMRTCSGGCLGLGQGQRVLEHAAVYRSC